MSFIHFGFLAAGAAAMTLPIWIHLLLRQKARTMEIGSIRFVQNVVRRTRSRQRIQRWLLLLLRCLAIALLGFLFARPFFPETPADGSTREVVVLIDRSASMSASHDDGESALERARRRADEYVQAMGDDTRVHIGLFDAGGVETISFSELGNARPAATGSDFDEAFAWAADVLASSARKDRSLLLLSDLQREAVRPGVADSLPPDITVQVEDPAPAIAQNLAIESVLPSQVEIRPGVPVAVSVRVFNSGAFPVTQLSVAITLQGPQGTIEAERSVSLAAGQRLAIELPLSIDQPGVYRGTAEIDRQDPMPWDNQRFVAFEVRHPDRLLLVDGESGRNAWENETYFLETALRLQTAVGEGPARTFEVERLVWDQGSGFPDLAGFRLIVMANLGRFTRADATRLESFVRGGGNVLMFVGQRTTPTVLEPLTESGLLADIKVAPPRDAIVHVRDFDREHPALQSFADPQHGQLRSLSVRRLMPIEQVPGDVQVLLRGQRWPLAICRDVGKGRIVLFATTADRQWNDWPQSRLFVPLVRQMAAWLTGALDARQSVVTEVITAGDVSPGIQSDAETLVVRNVDPRESDIGRMGIEQFRGAVGLEDPDPEDLQNEQQEFEPIGVSRSDEKWPWVVWTLLGLLGIEFLLASRVHE